MNWSKSRVVGPAIIAYSSILRSWLAILRQATAAANLLVLPQTTQLSYDWPDLAAHTITPIEILYH